MTGDPAAATESPRTARRRALRDYKRGAILDAARAVFAEHGLGGATIRGIAAEAGYAPGTLYLHYTDKEEIYAEILGEFLSRLGDAVKAAAATRNTPRERARRTLRTFYEFYADHPGDLDLGLYLFQGTGRHGLTPALDRRLNGRLIATLNTMADALADYAGSDRVTLNAETVALTSLIVGCLILDGTGRLTVLEQSADALVDRSLEALLDRCRPQGD